MRFRTILLTACCAGMAMPTAAGAIVYVTLTGKVTSGFDAGGVGLPGAAAGASVDLANKDFTASFAVDPLTFGAEDLSTPDGYNIRGYPEFGTVTPVFQAALSIEGASYVFHPSGGQIATWAGYPTVGGYDYLSISVGQNMDGDSASSSMNFTNYLFQDALSARDQTSAPVYTINKAQASQLGEFSIENDVTAAFRAITAKGTLDVRTISIATAPPGNVVPEPSTWALLIVGFGLVGTALRRSRALRAASACSRL